MKRFLTLIVSLVLVFSIAACTTPKETKDFKADIVDETITNNSIVISVVVEDKISSEEALKFIANEIAVEIFMKHQQTIGLKRMTLTIYLFNSTDDSTTTQASYGTATYMINDSAALPGLSQGVYQKAQTK